MLALEQTAVADEDALAVDGRDGAVAGDRLELLGAQPLDAALVGRFTIASASGCSLSLDGGDEAEQLAVVEAVAASLDDLRLAARQGACLVEHDRVERGGLLDRDRVLGIPRRAPSPVPTMTAVGWRARARPGR